MDKTNKEIEESITGCLLGTAAGDSLGLPAEGLPPERQARLFPKTDSHHFILGKGMVSDDTEHTLMVARALLESGEDEKLFAGSLARQMRFWFAGLPAGVGLATLKACMKLWIGIPPEKSGVFSAGNGPAMRSAIIGVVWGHQPEVMEKLLRISTRITHTDPKAYHGALTAAMAAYYSMKNKGKSPDPDEFISSLQGQLGEETQEFVNLLKEAAKSASRKESPGKFARNAGWRKGISGYVYQTVPAVIQAWFSYPGDFRKGLTEIIRAGGDTDTTGAILGGIIGAAVGKNGIPREWLDNIWEQPRSVSWIEKLGEAMAKASGEKTPGKCPPFNSLLIIPRNFIFTLTVLTHGFRRLFPPY